MRTTTSCACSYSYWTTKSTSGRCRSKWISCILSHLLIRLLLTLTTKILIIMLKLGGSARSRIKLNILSTIYNSCWSLSSFSSCLIYIFWLNINLLLFSCWIYSFCKIYTWDSSLFLIYKFINKIIYGIIITACKQSRL